MKRVLTTMASLSLLAAPAFAQDQAAPAKPKEDSSQRMICREDNVTGSVFLKRRFCMTAEQWRQTRRERGPEFERHTAQRSGAGSR